MNTDGPFQNPFSGLRSFTTEEDYLFFGREEQTMELLETLGRHRFVAVVGTSGSGKSSLVRCGLLSHLLGGTMLQAGTVWEVAVTHPGAAPLNHLADALLKAELYDESDENSRPGLLATLSRSHFGMVEAVRQAHLSDGTNFLLVVDQFEELFRFNQGDPAQRDAAQEFVSMLLQASRQQEVPIFIVLTMRSDFLGDCALFEGLAEAVNRGEYLIPRMTREQFKQSIEGPVRVAGDALTPRLLQRLLNDVGDQSDQLPCLQHALMRTWDHWARRVGNDVGGTEEVPMDLEDYDAVGRMREALSRHADEVYEGMPTDLERDLCEQLFKALTLWESENRGIRRPQRLARLAEILALPANELIPIIEAYRQPGVTFLMPPIEVVLSDDTVIDISHESLMCVWVRLRGWVDEEAQSAGIFHRLAESASLHEKDAAGLYGEPELGIALSWREEARPNIAWADQYGGHFAEAMAYLEWSRDAAEREENEREAARRRELEQARALAENERLRAEENARSSRRMKVLVAIASVVAAIAVIASFLALDARKSADRNAVLAQASEEEAVRSQHEAEAKTAEALHARQEAESAREELRRELYVADMHRVGVAYKEGNFSTVDELLLKHFPEGEEEDLRGVEWRLWWRAAHREHGALFSGHGTTSRIAVSPDRRWAAVSHNQAAWTVVFDTETKAVVKELNLHSETGRQRPGVASWFSPDSKRLVVGGPGPRLTQWSTESWESVAPDVVIPTNRASSHENEASERALSVEYVACSREGGYLAAVTSDEQVVVWERTTGRFVPLSDEIPANQQWFDVKGLSFAGEHLLAAAGTNSLGEERAGMVIWELPSGREIKRIGESYGGRSLAVSPDGRWIALGDMVGTVRVWDSQALDEPPTSYAGGSGPIVSIAFSPRMDRFVAGQLGGNPIQVWDIASQNLLGKIMGHEGVGAIQFVGDSILLATDDTEGVMAWDLPSAMMHVEVPGSSNAAGCKYLEGNRLAWRDIGRTGIRDRTREYEDPTGNSPLALPIRIYDVTPQKETAPWENGEPFSIFTTSRNGRYLAALPSDRRIRLWDVLNGRVVVGPHCPMEAGMLSALGVSDDARFVVWMTESSEVSMLWETKTGRIESLAMPLADEARYCYFSPDGLRLALGGWYETAVWDLSHSTPALMSVIPGWNEGFSPESESLAIGDWTGVIRLYDAHKPGRTKRIFRQHSDYIAGVTFSPDGKSLLSGSRDRTIRIWEVQTGAWRATLPAEVSSIRIFLADPEGKWIATRTGGTNLKIWPFPDEAEVLVNTDFLRQRVDRLAREERYARALELAWDLVDSAPQDVWAWFRLGALCLANGDSDGFDRCGRNLLARRPL